MKESSGRMKTSLKEEGESNDSSAFHDISTCNRPLVKKFHHISVCMVPPIHDNITKARTYLRDPGLFRWPPHANLLYPFINIDSSDDVIQRLEDATRLIEPFRCKIEKFGTFGGNNRGVLFLYPSSYYDHPDNDKKSEPLIDLQSVLMQHFPECQDQLKHGVFTPHITLSHFTNIDEALKGQKNVEEWWQPIEFTVSEIYCLIRNGDGGQFKRLLTLPLGSNKDATQIHDPPLPFPEMPLEEEDWIFEERMKLKERRNNNGRRRNRRSSSRSNRKQKIVDRGPSKSKDTPEEIAKKRAERAAKKAFLAREAASIAAAIEMHDENMF